MWCRDDSNRLTRGASHTYWLWRPAQKSVQVVTTTPFRRARRGRCGGLPVAKRGGGAAPRSYADDMAEHARVYPLRRDPQPEPLRQETPRQAPPLQAPRLQAPRLQEPRLQEPLWREVLGQRLRALRQEQRETLTETAGRAGISPQYLSEIERGRKEPSSEMIAALAGALGTTLIGLTEQVAGDLRRQQAIAPARTSRASGPVMLSLAA